MKITNRMGFTISFLGVCITVAAVGLSTGDPVALWGLLFMAPLSWIWFGKQNEHR